MAKLVAQRPLHLPRKQVAVVAEVAFQGVAVDHDPVLVAFRRDPVAEVLAVGVAIAAKVADHHGHPLQHPLEFLGKPVDRIRDEGFERIRLGLIHCLHVNQRRGEPGMRDSNSAANGRLDRIGAVFAALAIAAGGVVWSGCGGGDSDSSTNEAKQEIEAGAKKAEEAVEEGAETTKKGLEEAKEQLEKSKGKTSEKLEKAHEEAEEGLEEGTAKAEKGLEEAKEKADEYLP